jgi:hypothetical protein
MENVSKENAYVMKNGWDLDVKTTNAQSPTDLCAATMVHVTMVHAIVIRSRKAM